MKIYYSDMIGVVLPLSPSGTMIATAPDGVSCASDRLLKKKYSLPAVRRRGPGAGSFIEYNFHGSGVNRIDSCLFLQSRYILSLFLQGFVHRYPVVSPEPLPGGQIRQTIKYEFFNR
jgi:hypothetical protein